MDTSFTLSIQSGADFGQRTIPYGTKVHKVIPILNYTDSVYYNPPVIATAISDEKNVVISAKTTSQVTETRNYNIWCLIALDE